MRVIGLLLVLWVWSALLAVEGRDGPGLAVDEGRDAALENMYYNDGFYYYTPLSYTPFYFAIPIPGVPNPKMIPPFSLPWNPLPRDSQSPPMVPKPPPSNDLKPPPPPPPSPTPTPPKASPPPPPPPPTVAPPPKGSPSPPVDHSKECWGATSSSTSCSNNVCCTTIVYTGADCSTGTPRQYRKVERHCSPQTGS